MLTQGIIHFIHNDIESNKCATQANYCALAFKVIPSLTGASYFDDDEIDTKTIIIALVAHQFARVEYSTSTQ